MKQDTEPIQASAPTLAPVTYGPRIEKDCSWKKHTCESAKASPHQSDIKRNTRRAFGEAPTEPRPRATRNTPPD
jgi:hypothetical protein